MKIWNRPIAQNMNKKEKKNSDQSIQGEIFQIHIIIHILGNGKTPYFHSEIYWPLVQKQITGG